MTSPLLDVVAVNKSARDGDRDVKILRNVSFQIERGEKVALVGQSGSGKSTLLQILGALDTTYTGSVTVAGQRLRELTDADRAALRNRELGFIFQAYNLIGHLSVLHNVMLPARFSGQPTAPQRAEELLTSVGLQNHAHRKPTTLSGGERQRVAIARALYQKPELVFCDEPTGNLDSATGKEIIALFDRLTDQGVALLIATHDDALADGAHRTLRIADGSLV